MAKPREITGLDCSKKSLVWVSKILLTRFDEMAEFRYAATGSAEIKGVHDMRVAARRLRSAIRDIEPFLDKAALKDIKKELKKISDALGAVRDRDVAIGALKKLICETESDTVKAGIDQLVDDQTGARNIARADLESLISAQHIGDLQKRFAAAIKKAAAGAKKVSFNEAAPLMVRSNLESMLGLGAKVYKPFKQNGLHNLRIAAKRLRYSIELFALCGSDSAKPLAKKISRLQDYLGEVHDCDLWIKALGEILSSTAENERRNAAAWLLPIFVQRRNKEYLAALELWEEWQKNNFANEVREVLSLP